MKLSELQELDHQCILNTYKRHPLQIVRGEGVYVYDENGKKYLDFLSGIAVNALGYAHPSILEAIQNQAKELIHISNLFYTELPARLAQKLCTLSGMDKVFFCNSGAEANELALKISRVHSKSYKIEKNKIVCMENSFHGRTIGSLSVTKSSDYSEKFAPLFSGSVFVEFNNIEALNNSVNDETSAIIIEPIQGEGGVNVASSDFLEQARYLADKFNAILVFDEVQCGIGRTGEYFAFQNYCIKPDIVTLAKPLGAGLPMGAVLVAESVAQCLQFGDHGSTFGGNSLVSACALAFLDVIENEQLLLHIRDIGQYFTEQLNILKDKYSFIKEVRGKGLMLGLDLNQPSADLVSELINQGLITNSTSNTVIRFLPPYIIQRFNVDEAIATMKNVFSAKYD